MDEKINSIKNRWAEENRYRMIEKIPCELFEKAQTDIRDLLALLESYRRRQSELELKIKRYEAMRGNPSFH